MSAIVSVSGIVKDEPRTFKSTDDRLMIELKIESYTNLSYLQRGRKSDKSLHVLRIDSDVMDDDKCYEIEKGEFISIHGVLNYDMELEERAFIEVNDIILPPMREEIRI